MNCRIAAADSSRFGDSEMNCSVGVFIAKEGASPADLVEKVTDELSIKLVMVTSMLTT